MIFCGPGIVKVNVIRIIGTMIGNKDSLSRLILVVQNRVTNQAMKAMDLFSFKVEVFQVSFRSFEVMLFVCHSLYCTLSFGYDPRSSHAKPSNHMP